jgi:hypothetical protein
MIQVQIASQLTRRGVDGVRWVLIDSAEPGAGAPTAPATGAAAAGMADAAQSAANSAAQSAAQAPGDNPRATVSLALLRLAVLAVGLALAWGATQWLVVQPQQGLRSGPDKAVPQPATPPSPAASATSTPPAVTA